MGKILKSTYNSSAKGIIWEHIHIFCDKTGLSFWKSKKNDSRGLNSNDIYHTSFINMFLPFHE